MNKPSKYFKEKFSIDTSKAVANESCIFIKDNTRFTLISDRILRVESGELCDLPTQKVVCRNFDHPKIKITEKKSKICISSKKSVFVYDLNKHKMLSITMNDGKRVTDFTSGNLGGTARTLDMVNGSTGLEFGMISKTGVTVLDDSKSCVLNADGTISERKNCTDHYYFAFGRDYRGCIKALTELCGKIPLIPRYALGNWWSRYKAYSQNEYLELMKKFKENDIPITVATVDMDWHWTDVIQRFGKENVKKGRSKHFKSISEIFQPEGWTGYSWNTELFPDHKSFLSSLHDDGMKVPLNLHPAQGIRAFEKCYKQMAEHMGIDPASKETIDFDITDPKFIEGYFKIIHSPLEDEGVDFWWIDWQQEKTTKVKGLDPLWALNHYHTLAFSGQNKRPLILSRYAGIGSHRYPLGFSGDTIISWKSLDFQPYFTANAANVGYTWWSHDIGGHQLGRHDDELYARWVQLGEYSPIMRLHSTSDEFMGKEPWNYSFAAAEAATNALRERHMMLPYLYTMNKRTHEKSIALCEPVYYRYPDDENAYKIKNEYFFGSELLVCPITSAADKRTKLAGTEIWLPDGRWTDIYTGYIYKGNQFVKMFRDMSSIPVLAKEGSIIPISDDSNGNNISNPENLTLRIWRGNGEFTLYEDDGETMNFQNGEYAETKFKITQTGTEVEFTVYPAVGDLSVIPKARNYTLIFEDIAGFESADISVDTTSSDVAPLHRFGKTTLIFKNISQTSLISVKLKRITAAKNPPKKELVINRLSKIDMTMIEKRIRFSKYIKNPDKPLNSLTSAFNEIIEEIHAME